LRREAVKRNGSFDGSGDRRSRWGNTPVGGEAGATGLPQPGIAVALCKQAAFGVRWWWSNPLPTRCALLSRFSAPHRARVPQRKSTPPITKLKPRPPLTSPASIVSLLCHHYQSGHLSGSFKEGRTMATAADHEKRPALRLVYSAPAKRQAPPQPRVSAKDLILCSRRLTSTAKVLVRASRDQVRSLRRFYQSWREHPGSG
jgi:hypothetical protein